LPTSSVGRLAQPADAGLQYFSGQIDEVRVETRELPPAAPV